MRTMVTFLHKTASRPAAQETLLSMFMDDGDATSSEHLRLYLEARFTGNTLLRTQERAATSYLKKHNKVSRIMPRDHEDVEDREYMIAQLRRYLRLPAKHARDCFFLASAVNDFVGFY